MPCLWYGHGCVLKYGSPPPGHPGMPPHWPMGPGGGGSGMPPIAASAPCWWPLPRFLECVASGLPGLASDFARRSRACGAPSAPYSTRASTRMPWRSTPGCASAGASNCTKPSTWGLRSNPNPSLGKYRTTVPSHQPTGRRGNPASTATGPPLASSEPPFSRWMTSAAHVGSSNRSTPRDHTGEPSPGGGGCIRLLPGLLLPALSTYMRRSTVTSARVPYHSKRSRSSASLHCGGTGKTHTTPPWGSFASCSGAPTGVAALPIGPDGPAKAWPTVSRVRTCQARSCPSGRRYNSASTSRPSISFSRL
mmetsp:Transcript_27778/g.78628  ORF Transcript_27778/g.78628 Transcript_27778/m.78628 type:complete len:307 (+) Transcript_27778:452-1372(+)